MVNATSPSDAVTFVPITPCRVLDTRPAFKVGPKTTPLGPGEVHTVSAHGDNGRCTDIPATATGLSLNITALDASLPTFLTVWATGAPPPQPPPPQPDSSSLNPAPGQPPAPNAVTTGISANGRFDIFNLQGTVDVIGDINGYYTDHDHDDRYYTRPQVDGAVAGASEVVRVFTEPFVSPDFVPERTFTPVLFTTTVSGSALIDLESGLNLICELAGEPTGAWHYLVVDGQPLDGSQRFTRRSTSAIFRNYVGFVELLPAGEHTAELGAECQTGTMIGFTTSSPQSLSVIVDAN